MCVCVCVCVCVRVSEREQEEDIVLADPTLLSFHKVARNFCLIRDRSYFRSTIRITVKKLVYTRI